MNRWSLRSRLFVLIVMPLALVACLAAAARFVMAERMSQQLYDDTLLAVALTISRDVVLSDGDMLTEQLLDALTNALGDPVYYRIEGPEGRFVTGYSDAPPRPDTAEIDTGIPYFYDATSFGQPVRVVTLREFIAEQEFGGWVTVDVWQTKIQREALSLQLFGQSVVLMAVVVSAAALLVWFGINLGLRPLLQLREAVAERSDGDLRPIKRVVPKEVRNLVGAVNSLFARLTEAFALRDAFISDAAHQLRNPIAAIQAQAEAATTAPNEAILRQRVTKLAETARRTGRLTQQLLSMEKARGRSETDSWQTIDISALAETLTRRFAEHGMRSGIEVSFNISGQPHPVFGDQIMLSEAIENLLDNASHYGCPNGGEITLALTFGPEDVTITVQDDGPGIPPDMRERIFDRFIRLNDDSSGGCGLGLAIVRKIAEAHGGTARVLESQRGALFELHIPLMDEKERA
ncbi:sensor histidine kinase (plasmid) [Pseudorhodobacter turbinis]|uniref:histidine kinase n=1 Tax=Pseudorhodobacter turbinis TaxID=2500533 RepID=A0A4V1E1F4_9RHOB|nr:sensor histidine kinase [Pseudorhodobacter turbinis]QCO57944.1 sensor histidine kinase [Pseudorhodobacter turbinis]